jgi:quercetin dioxygenase-like cupin family protein
MTKSNQWSFPMLAVSLALFLPGLAHAQVSATEPAARNMAEMKFGPLPPLPTCASGSVQTGDPAKGAFIILAKLTTGCSLPWHWHTAGENLMIVSGTARVEIKDGPSQTLRAGSYVQLPSRHVHQFQCKNNCTFFFYSDGAWDMHYVDAKGTEIPPEDALKALKEKPAKAMK